MSVEGDAKRLGRERWDETVLMIGRHEQQVYRLTHIPKPNMNPDGSSQASVVIRYTLGLGFATILFTVAANAWREYQHNSQVAFAYMLHAARLAGYPVESIVDASVQIVPIQGSASVDNVADQIVAAQTISDFLSAQAGIDVTVTAFALTAGTATLLVGIRGLMHMFKDGRLDWNRYRRDREWRKYQKALLRGVHDDDNKTSGFNTLANVPCPPKADPRFGLCMAPSLVTNTLAPCNSDAKSVLVIRCPHKHPRVVTACRVHTDHIKEDAERLKPCAVCLMMTGKQVATQLDHVEMFSETHWTLREFSRRTDHVDNFAVVERFWRTAELGPDFENWS